MPNQVSPEDLMRYLDGELSEEDRERVGQHVTGCRRLLEEIDFFRTLGSDLRALLRSIEIPHHSIWDLVWARLRKHPLGP